MWVLGAYILMLSALAFFGTTAVVAVILAFVRRAGTDDIVRSHYDFIIRTFWIGFGIAVLCLGCFAAGIATLIPELANAWRDPTLDWHEIPFNYAFAGLMLAGGVGLLGDMLYVLVACVYGAIALASGRMIGQVRDRRQPDLIL